MTLHNTSLEPIAKYPLFCVKVLEYQIMNHVNDGKFLGLLGFLGFLGFWGFHGSEQYPYLFNLVWLSLLSLGSFLVFVPRRRRNSN